MCVTSTNSPRVKVSPCNEFKNLNAGSTDDIFQCKFINCSLCQDFRIGEDLKMT